MAKPLEIYFACSIRGEQGGKEEKQLIVDTMKNLGHIVLSEIFIERDINTPDTALGMTPQQIFDRDIEWVNRSDVVVADVSRISLGVGIEIGWKLAKGGRVIGICQEQRYEPLSNMMKGCTDPQFRLIRWNSPDFLRTQLEEHLGQVNTESP